MKELDSDDEDYTQDFKIVLIGSSGVGKTCIIKYFINHSFKISEQSTLSASYYEKVIELDQIGTKIKFEIWDTVGQERYKSMVDLFFRNSKAAIIVYDISNYQSFEDIKNYWYEKINEVNPKNKSSFFNYYTFYYYSNCYSWQ